MKSVDFLKAVGGVVAMVVACHTYAQASDSASTGTTAAAPAASSKKENRALGKKVRSALAKTQGLDVSNINVRARSGAVTLTGTAPDNDQIQKAGEVAKGVAGVTSVTNKINVQQQ
ncbi:BON domain-containing protein [Paraburkholderia sp. LEh10]|uniref:BON domain-containing protein n=1 Tax=Paraburkholderia sp. LEh10 TaxID=2821353 RepID=UPI001AE64EFE|nr:BON domain-containing protein [Paraburkholderia sp. LEh10]MBP0591260.1 BON domain-containing protein [Paraburkholderia sp. LEh10]